MKLITGAPGAGKTNRLVSEIHKHVLQGISPYMILATTFSRQAAREITDRVGGDVPVRTIHGMAYWLIRLARQARGVKVPQVISEDRALSFMERAAKELDIRFIEPKQAMMDMERIRALGGKYDALHPMVQQIIQRYVQILQVENLVDFTGLLEQSMKELEDEELRAFLKGMYVLVDEAQDLNPVTEWPVLDVLLKGSKEFILLASPSQSIYGFRGADWGKLVMGFPQALQTEVMLDNHRSTPEIIHAARPLAGPDASGMRPIRPSLGIPVIAVDALNPEMEIDFVGRQLAEWIEDFHQRGIGMAEIAVLTRTHAQLNPLQIALRLRSIPYHIVGSQPDVFQREETQAVLGYLRLTLNPMDDSVLESIVNYPPCGIGSRTRYQLRRDDRMNWDHLITVLGTTHQYREQVVERVKRILDLREILADLHSMDMQVSKLVTNLLHLTEISSYLNSEGDFAASRALGGLMETSVEFSSLVRFVEYLEEQVSRPREAEGIQLSTLHASKGRDWRAVIIPGFHDGLLPLEGADLNEERNLAFVGLTRAKDRLVLTMPRTMPMSPFLAGVPLKIVRWP